MSSKYHIHSPVHRGSRSQILRATRVPTGEQVILKEGALDRASSLALARSRREFSIASPIRSPHVAQYLGVEQDQGRVAVVVEAFGDASLAQLLARSALSVEGALRIGIQIAAGLVDIHAHDVIHRAIHPGNVLVETSTMRAKIVDFAAASLLEENPGPSRCDAQAIPLAYISPEQTGRMNRGLDYRTDFYSLGATLYHALSGRPPFQQSDPLSLVHAHIASAPRPLSKLNPHVPKAVSDIVDKLIAKNAEDRYQSARGIVADLERCLQQLESSGEVAPFPLGQQDVPDKFVIPQRLYGRSTERAALLKAFESAAAGSKLLLLVGGPSGIGKSALVNEVHKPILERRGTFVAGKFDPLHQHAPYSALAQALRQLCRGLLTLPQSELTSWKTRILELVSVNVGLIVNLAPELEQIVGPQPPVPATGLMEAQHRFDVTLARFLSAFASSEHPLVIFLDDLQRADPATLHALSAVLRLPEPTHLLVIGAYRDNEVDEDHPLSRALDEIRAAGVVARSVRLAGLGNDDVLTLLAETLHQPPAAVGELAQVTVQKTAGNPFFVHQFVRALYDEKHLRFSHEQGAWTWNVRTIETLGITDNVVDLMLRKMERLPPTTQESLQIGACVGTTFELALLAKVVEVTPACMRARLAPAIRDGLVVPLDPEYPLGLVDVSSDQEEDGPNYRHRFLHDRVQQAAYESIPESERAARHLSLGRILAAQGDPQRIFEAVDQLNRGAHLITEPSERIRLCELNLQAGKRAQASTAYSEALAYLERGLKWLPGAADSEHARELSRALHLAFVENAYRAGRFEDAERLANTLLPTLRTGLERAPLYTTRIVLETQRGNHRHAIALAREALVGLGHPIPPIESITPLLTARAKVALAMHGKSVESLAKLPELADPQLVAAVDILNMIHASAYLSDPKLFYWLAQENLLIALEHGMTTSMMNGFMNYGMCLLAQSHDYSRALAFGRLALSMAERSGAFPYRAQVYCTLASCLTPYADDLRNAVQLNKRAIEMALESGDLVIASFALTVVPETMFMTGAQLAEVYREAERSERSIRSFRGVDMLHSMSVIKQLVRSMRGETEPRGSFSSQDVSEAVLAAEMKDSNNLSLRVFYPLRRTLACVIFGDYAQAIRLILAYDKQIELGTRATYILMDYSFFACLALTAALREGTAHRRTLGGMLRKKRRMLARWAESAPATFRHKHLLVCAELEDLKGRWEPAMKLYDAAIRESEVHEHPRDAALAAELAGRASLRRANRRLARAYWTEARASYERWGALGKVQALDEEHPELAASPARAQGAPLALDLVSVIRTSQALSQEISLPALLERIMRVIVQTSGAQRGSLLRVPETEESGALQIEAHLDNAQSAVLVRGDAESLGHGFVSEAIVRYTMRAGEDVVLADAGERGAFTRDPYVVAHGSKSILSMAVRQRDRVVGVLFLENELSIGAFTEERLEVLRLLLAQAAISLENARLVDSLRTQEGLLRDFLEGMPLGVYVTDAHGRPAFANRKALEIGGQGLDPETTLETATATFQVYLAGTDQLYPLERSPLARALQGETSMVEDVELRQDGKRLPLGVWATPIRGDDGSVRYAIVAFQDLSAQRAMKNERERLEAQLQQAARLEAIGRLAGGVAHDFNNLLTPMLVYTELAAHSLPASSATRQQIEHVHDAAERGAALTRQLLAFGRKQAIEPHEVDVNQELVGFQRMFRRLVREDIEVELHLAPDLAKVRADPASLQRILMNLGMNAVDAMPHGGRVLFETENVVRAESSGEKSGPFGECVALRVVDNGQGIDKDALDRIFDPFFTTKAPGKGTGLGLPTVYGLVEQHGGHLSVQTNPGKGSCFEILLPRLQETGPTPVQGASAEVRAPEQGRGETILVAEDDSAVRAVVKDVLVRGGYRVIATDDAREALKLAQELGDALDLLVTDVVMPGMNGRELVETLSKTRPNLRALFISGYSEEVLDSSLLDNVRIALLPKPLTAQSLQAKVHEMLAKRRASSARVS